MTSPLGTKMCHQEIMRLWRGVHISILHVILMWGTLQVHQYCIFLYFRPMLANKIKHAYVEKFLYCAWKIEEIQIVDTDRLCGSISKYGYVNGGAL